MSISVNIKSDTEFVISLGERFDFGCVEDFRKAYESVQPKGKAQVVMDFRGTRYMDSSALGMLINARSHFNSDEVKVSLANCNDQIKKIFSISRFDRKFEIS